MQAILIGNMDPLVRTSFIPKKPVVQATAAVHSGGVGVFFFIALVIFLGSILLGAGAFGYEQYLQKSIKSKSDSLTKARAAFEPATIQDLMRLDKRLSEAKVILDGHTAPSAIFTLLSANTLSTVAFDKFDLSTGPDIKGVVQLHGKTATFSDVALQSDAFNKERAFKDVLFAGFTVAKDGGVEFTVSASVDPEVINYRSNLLKVGEVTDSPALTPTTPTPTSSSTPRNP